MEMVYKRISSSEVRGRSCGIATATAAIRRDCSDEANDWQVGVDFYPLNLAIIYLTYRLFRLILESWKAPILLETQSSTSRNSRTAESSWLNCVGLTAL